MRECIRTRFSPRYSDKTFSIGRRRDDLRPITVNERGVLDSHFSRWQAGQSATKAKP